MSNYLRSLSRRFFEEDENRQPEFSSILSAMEDIYMKKNEDYGSSFEDAYKLYGESAIGYVVTIKSKRIEQLIAQTKEPNYESLEDNLLDLANYCVMSLMALKKGRENE